MAVEYKMVILVFAVCFIQCVLAELPRGTQLGEKELVTVEMFQQSGKAYLMVLDVDSTILVRFKPIAEKEVFVCRTPGFPLRMDAKGNILECGIMRPGFTRFIMETKDKFFLILYTANDLKNAKSVARTLEDMYPGTAFAVRANPHIHGYPLLEDGSRMDKGGSKDLRNIMDEALIPLAVILEDVPLWYTRLPRAPNQLLCLIQVPELILEWKSEEGVYDVFYNDRTLFDVRMLLDRILNPPKEGIPPTLRQILDAERVLQNRTDAEEMWITSADLSCKSSVPTVAVN